MKLLYFMPTLAVLCLVPIGFINAQTEPIPSWIRNNAGLWADGMIGDETFLAGIGFLIESGIIPADQTHANQIQELKDENERLRADLLLIPGYKDIMELDDIIKEKDQYIEELENDKKSLEYKLLQSSLEVVRAEDYVAPDHRTNDSDSDDSDYVDLKIIKCGTTRHGYVEVKYGIYSDSDYDLVKTQILLEDSSGNVIDAIDDYIDLRAGMTVYSDRLLDGSPLFDSCVVQIVN